MIKKALLTLAIVSTFPFCVSGAGMDDVELALRDIDRAMAIADATWSKCMKGSNSNLYMADQYDTSSGWTSGASDVWPYTAAIEAHCSLLEALDLAIDRDESTYVPLFEKYRVRLDLLIDNLAYYRGAYLLSSYATSNHTWRPYAVPRASSPNKANVSGILNVYDDQMWLCRELIRAYKLVDNKDYLDLAAYLADYCIDGWDCWRDDNGEEYGGITWGPGYNSKHSCSNGPFVQPLVWLYEIYKDSGETMKHYYRSETNSAKSETRQRSDVYLEFARKVYDWQRAKLYDSAKGVYWDMMGADGEIKVSRGYRQHVDCGGPVGAYYSYNTGTMIGGAAELYRVTGESRYVDELSVSTRSSVNNFSKFVRAKGTYDFNTDATATEGFNTWFNNVLMRAMVDAMPYCTNSYAKNGVNAFQTNLDYAFENYNRNNMLPIHLLDGWGSETKTKAFHQFTFVSQYGRIASYKLKVAADSGVEDVVADIQEPTDDTVYNLSGIPLGSYSEVKASLRPGIYIVGGRKVAVK